MSYHERTIGIKYGMVIDLDRCTGCGTCSVACMAENNIYTLKDESNKLRSITWMRVYRIENGKQFPDTKVSYIPRPCMQCDYHTPCVPVCPVEATTKDEVGGIVSQIASRCIGCRYCMAACPYHTRYFNWFDPWPLYKKHVEQMTDSLNPDVSPRMRGVVEKCVFCHHRLMAARERVFAEEKKELPKRGFMLEKDKDMAKGQEDAGPEGKKKSALEQYRMTEPLDIPEDYYVTACAQACPAEAIMFGDLNNPKHRVHTILKERKKHAFRLLEKLGIEPKVYYLSSSDWVQKKADNFLDIPKGNGY